MLNVYALRDKKSGVLSNHFLTSEPFSKVQQQVSISLLEISLKEDTNPFVLFSDDYDLVHVCDVPEELKEVSDIDQVNCSVLLAASRKAFSDGQDHTSQDDELNI